METGKWVTPDGKEHKGVFYGIDPGTGNKHLDIPSLPGGVLSGGHWESDGEAEYDWNTGKWKSR